VNSVFFLNNLIFRLQICSDVQPPIQISSTRFRSLRDFARYAISLVTRFRSLRDFARYAISLVTRFRSSRDFAPYVHVFAPEEFQARSNARGAVRELYANYSIRQLFAIRQLFDSRFDSRTVRDSPTIRFAIRFANYSRIANCSIRDLIRDSLTIRLANCSRLRRTQLDEIRGQDEVAEISANVRLVFGRQGGCPLQSQVTGQIWQQIWQQIGVNGRVYGSKGGHQVVTGGGVPRWSRGISCRGSQVRITSLVAAGGLFLSRGGTARETTSKPCTRVVIRTCERFQGPHWGTTLGNPEEPPLL
jgi:hypothetical protein